MLWYQQIEGQISDKELMKGTLQRRQNLNLW